MPADPDALAAAGVHQEAGDFANSTAVAHPHLAFLGDVFAVPASWPVSNVFSVGDVVLVVAALLALHCLCGSRLALVRFAAPRRASAQAPALRRPARGGAPARCLAPLARGARAARGAPADAGPHRP